MTLPQFRLDTSFPYLLTIGGVVGLIASFILTHDTAAIANNAHYIPSCDINPVLSCGSVINEAGDKILGLPYPYYGLAAFPTLITTGAAMLAGAKFKRWYWLIFQLFVSLGTLGAYLLLLKSIYKIHALCPYCLTVDVVITIIFWYVSLRNIDTEVIVIRNSYGKSIYLWARSHHLDLLVFWLLLVMALILKHFWYYYGKHL